jgi:hypothetical protein
LSTTSTIAGAPQSEGKKGTQKSVVILVILDK